MTIRKSYVSGVYYRSLQPVYRVDGDGPFKTYPDEESAKAREAELAKLAEDDKK